MCLVEIEGLPKLELACSTQVRDGMKVSTKSEAVVEARNGVLEFLLAEHPLDCPICDKAGECKLQDYYEQYGFFESQYKETKEKREKKAEIGKNLIHDKERCVLCTRCVRFLREVTKTQELGVFNRGLHSEVDIYNGEPIDNNYSGNLAEICPVGAITDSDFRFKTRSWFLKNGESVCPLCSRGCNIIIEYHPGFARFPVPKRVYRIKARENQDVNGFWICDLGRYGYSYLNEDRADEILTNNQQKTGSPSWEEARSLIVQKIKSPPYKTIGSRMALILHSWLSNEEFFLIRKIFQDDLGVEKIFFADPPEGEKDDHLLTSERCPNRRGAQEVGFDFKPFDLSALDEDVCSLVVFGNFLSDQFSQAESGARLEKIGTKVLFTSYKNEWNSLFDIVIPTAMIAEKEGSLTNLDGKVQDFQAVLEPLGASLPEWKALVDLAKELKINFDYYRRLYSVEAISNGLRKEIPFFGKKSD
ncbi:MAG: molybdopterin-dependent oxidoreductase [Candidatus Aminicenantes bacterium]|nr:MAG: molybdopterin-dependent oxidoreductase [Candidatus Aminicenantes bacterium]